ncbi:uncharacterized protein J4E92_006376 [Alternaria infectoria]|uniref:uncharacterized protein n=1 Tax=Alternaria infectoria TaxID=45303 RepID=UPI00221FF057|nr:uncharacterized protein J4E92_006376 [Alternaria infectoria]KAI4927209.1 hypothetical protein J4E92_006376 [Alternaria infectoria]
MSSPTTGRQRGTASKAPRKTPNNNPDVNRRENQQRARAPSGATPRVHTRKRSRSGPTSALADEDDDDDFDSEHDVKVKKGRTTFDENGYFKEGNKSMRYFGPGFTDLYSPSVSHQLIHTGLYNQMPPRDNRQHLLQGLDCLFGMDARTWVKDWKKKKGVTKPVKGAAPPAPQPIIHTTSHYTFTPGVNRHIGFDITKTPYALIDCAEGVHPCNFPQGLDRGPFTEALIQAQLMIYSKLMLADLDAFIAYWLIDRNLQAGYSDAGFLKRHVALHEEYRAMVRKDVESHGYRWED